MKLNFKSGVDLRFFKSALSRRLFYSLLFLMCTPFLIYSQQESLVSGIVTDASTGESLQGVTVIIKQTNTVAITDSDGKYAINAGEGTVLVFSYLGYKTQEISVKSGKIIDVALAEDATLLDEVVVVGYGSVKKANLTGSVDQISQKVLEDRPIVSVAQALQGTIANLNISTNTNTGTGGGGAPGAGLSMNIRGVTGLSSGSAASAAGPLIVVDGIQSQDINAVNPNDIESISVLKDAASSAIYGSNAPYGVILITTKKGSKTSKPAISYSTNLGWSSSINVPEMMNSVEWAKVMNDAQQNTSGRNFLSDENMKRIQDYYDGKIQTSTVTNPGRTAGASWSHFDDYGQGLSNDNINWYDVYLKNSSFSQQHNVGLQGGAQNVTYYVGLGYNQKEGMLRYGDDSFKRYSIRANLSSEITNWFTANFRGLYTKRINDKPSNTGNDNFMQQIAQRWPIIPLRNNDGRYSEQSNILLYQDGGRNISTDNVNVLTGEFVITPLKGWNATFNYSYTANNITSEINRLHVILYDADGRPFNSPGWTSDGFDAYTRASDSMTRGRTDDERHTINAFTSYELSLKGHDLKAMVGYTQEHVYYYTLNANSGNVTLYNVDIPTFQTMYYNTNNQSISETNKQTLTTRGVFGRLNYGYKDRYLVEFNGRYDGSSRYMKDVRFKFYPGVSGGWVVSSENFWNETLGSQLNFLKLRASYGSLGEQSGGYYPFYPSLGVTPATSANWLFDGGRFASLSFPGIVNPNLTWITSTTVDVGIDLSLLKNRLSIAYDWYNRSSEDVVGPAQELPAVLGVAAPSTNNAALTTKGFDLTLSWRDRIKSIGLSYGIRATLSDSKSVVDKYPNEKKSVGTWYEGAVIGDIWGYVTDGYYTQAEQSASIDQNVQGNPKGPGTNWTAGDIKYKDLDGDNLITYGDNTLDNPGDRKVIGNNRPRYAYGITLDASWKGFDVSVFFQGIGKRDAWIATSGPSNFWGTQNSEWQANFLTIHRDRWTPETPDGYFPKYYLTSAQNTKNQQVQTRYLQDASYLRIKNLQLGYTLPKSLLDKIGISKLRFYVSGENLATFTDFVETIDPEFATLDRGLGYPLQRTLSFGLNLSF
ncbi:MAG: TonB-dependent receptor [Dysgonamonadaceae bacterium]|jgi:TonB-linked SusC/RagA family outer membrane protein|nr:TonB-dependent receptor [Dysgonamonadaceae bacterium]